MRPEFEWDKGKAAKNIEKHGIAFDEAKSIFKDPGFITVVDEEHSIGEERYISIGLSENGKLLLLAHTEREGRIRIISVRKATRKEERFYEYAQ
uniref:Uncharacterized protein n=1 Tax=Candidatus Kentrum sp. FW TaxID=2126338 RepID=A0A450THE1_9GAMM|nr:MAG: hypothetical protein BECKFW1821C_GA0114237_101048 [Candidatus Kentron sp. FW]